MSGYRIAHRFDTRIDWQSPLFFEYDGAVHAGYAGDTLASALLAGGAGMLARSFKYGRPRGIVAAGPEEPNVLVQVEATPDLKATEVELYADLKAARTSGWPTLRFDLKSIAGRFGRFMPAGFYYKTLMAPSAWWPHYEKWLRAAAGFGTVPMVEDHDRYDHQHHHVDDLVVGAGAAGLLAALTAARAGRRVLVVDEQSEAGGYLLTVPAMAIGGQTATSWREQVLGELRGMANVTLLARATAIAMHDFNLVLAVERLQDHLPPAQRSTVQPRERLHRIRAAQVVLATGAILRPLVFERNDLPGVMTAAAAHTYLNRYGVAVGRRALVLTGTDAGYAAACDLAAAGVEVTLADVREHTGVEWQQRARMAGVEVLPGHGIARAIGGRTVRGACLVRLADDGQRIAGSGPRWDGDVIASAGGLVPTLHLYCHDGSRPAWDDRVRAFVPSKPARAGVVCVGAVTGTTSMRDALAQTARAIGALFARNIRQDIRLDTDEPAPGTDAGVFRVADGGRRGGGAKAFVDLQNDVSVADIHLAVRENYRSVEHLKRYTGLGFGTDQGKLSGINGFGIAAEALGMTIADVGTTTYRPAYTPVSFGALAGAQQGETYEPCRSTPLHRLHVAQGAVFEPVGQWLRPRCFPAPDESIAAALGRECRAVRSGVALMDVSTLGKIDIRGADAREFLNRVYTNSWRRLAAGKCRYGLMLDENGMVMDDGVSACIADDHFLMTTTTGGAARVLRWLELWLQTEWPQLKVYLTSVTDHWATTALAGPRSRSVLEKLCTDIDLSGDAFKFMEWRRGRVAGVPARVYRISFSGELAYEVNVDACHGEHLWQAALEAGREFAIAPYGTDAMHVLRAEKGYIIVGQDTDGSVTPNDLGMDWAVDLKKPFSFLGKRSLARADTARTDRRQLVGLLTEVPEVVLGEGAQIIERAGVSGRSTPMLGHVTSSYYSGTLGHSIALALVARGRARHGTRLYAWHHGTITPVRVVSPIFYDVEGARQHD